MRNNHRTACHCRAYATSDNGGESFAHFGYDAALPSPVCQATLSSAGGNLLFANPADAGEGFSNARMQGTIKKSTDMGAPSPLPLRARIASSGGGGACRQDLGQRAARDAIGTHAEGRRVVRLFLPRAERAQGRPDEGWPAVRTPQRLPRFG